ncbi:ferric iron reductase [Dactylosporangium sp. CA-092794]|uniref:ferric iron reductase n=1 Tax=Dactylosporangium sp. CA-092794 TaxID=3239929 RepID=UPI003D8A7FFE
MRIVDARDPIALWQYAERYLGVGTRTYSPYAADLDIADEYHPQRGAASFELPTFRVPPGHGVFRTAAARSPLPDVYRDGDGFLLPVHPSTLDAPALLGRDELRSCPPGPPLTVVPSANARTVFVTAVAGAPVEPHFVKLHYPRRLSRFTRRLRRPVIELQLWVSDDLLRAGTPVLPEVAGGWFGPGLGDEAWGFLIRAARPQLDAPRYTVPLFALYGHDLHAPADPPLLRQLVEAFGEDPLTFVTDRVVVPMVRLWSHTVRATGCPLETHGQNTLFAFDPATRRTRILYRDCAIYVDAALRQAGNLPGGLPPANVIPRDVPMPADEVFSLTYDSFMGHHALSYVAALARDAWGVPERSLHEAARAAFTAPDLLPPTVFYYENALYDNGDWKLVDTGNPPLWR